jgi:hypothetical protein
LGPLVPVVLEVLVPLVGPLVPLAGLLGPSAVQQVRVLRQESAVFGLPAAIAVAEVLV